MHLSGEYHIPAGEIRVWEAMNDPALLKRCIAVCESFEQIKPELFVARIKIGLGPFHARFTIDVTIHNAAPPHAYTLIAEGRGGLAGWARGIADVKLEPREPSTLLIFTAHGEFRGAVARLAARVVEGTAKRYADEFFATFAQEINKLPDDAYCHDTPAVISNLFSNHD